MIAYSQHLAGYHLPVMAVVPSSGRILRNSKQEHNPISKNVHLSRTKHTFYFRDWPHRGFGGFSSAGSSCDHTFLNEFRCNDRTQAVSLLHP